MSVSTTTKKTYNKNGKNYGKYYTYKRIRGIMSTYFRGKLTMSLYVGKRQNPDAVNVYQYIFYYTDANNNEVRAARFSLAELFSQCNKFADYNKIFGYYKPRGLLVEVIPGARVALVGHIDNIYEGMVVIGLGNLGRAATFKEITDFNMHILLDRENRQRNYWRFLIKDFSETDQDDNFLPNALPYDICIAQNQAMAQDSVVQSFTVNLTFYITYRQSIA